MHAFFRVQVSASAAAPASGRLLIFVKSGSGDQEIDNEPFRPEATWGGLKYGRQRRMGSVDSRLC